MAKIAKTDAVVGGRCQIPKDLYRARCIGAKYGKSAKDLPMTTLTCEVIGPESIEVNGQEYRIVGRQFKLYLMNVPEESWGQAQVFEFMDKLGIDHGGEYDTDLVKEYFLGMEFDIVLDSEEAVMRKAPQPGQREGDVIKDGEGNPITNGWNIQAQMSGVPDKCAPTRIDLPSSGE
jgi:hypothetical protein